MSQKYLRNNESENIQEKTKLKITKTTAIEETENLLGKRKKPTKVVRKKEETNKKLWEKSGKTPPPPPKN